jgi:signal transduction histidine kinase
MMNKGNDRTLDRYLDWLAASPLRALVFGVTLALLVATAAMVWLMRPPLRDLAVLVRTLAFTSVLSLGAGFLLFRRGLARLPSLGFTLALTNGWAALLTLVNVLVMAELMFVNAHDLALSLVLLLFAAVIATAYGIFVAASITDTLRQLATTAGAIATGDLEARVRVHSRDEVAQVADAFNEMASQLQRAEQKRREVEQLRRDLVAWTSHDLRTPLTSIRAMIEALHDGVVTEEKAVARYYRTIRSDVVALNNLIDDLFELAQLEAGGLSMEMARHALGDVISDALESFRAVAAQGQVALRGSVGNDVDPVIMNAPKIGRVLANLLGNALQHTPPGGAVEIVAQRTATGVEVLVNDTGPGFAARDLPRVFEQFYRGEEARSRSTGGSGLGLAIAHAIVESHGGQMWAKNRQERGACVGFLLPDAFPDRDQQAAALPARQRR